MTATRGGIVLKSPREVGLMREANAHTAAIVADLCAHAEPGMSTLALDLRARRLIAERGVKSAFLGYFGYPAVTCISINEEVVHGIPRRNKIIAAGDLVSIDFGVVVGGYVGDHARSVVVGQANDGGESERLCRITEECLERAILCCTPDYRLSDIGQAVQTHAEAHGLGIVRDFVGHGIGTRMHEEPQIPNYFDGHRPRLRAGMVVAIEPMLNLGSHKVRVLADGWTAVTADGRRSAHFEHSIAITEHGPEVLSRLP